MQDYDATEWRAQLEKLMAEHRFSFGDGAAQHLLKDLVRNEVAFLIAADEVFRKQTGTTLPHIAANTSIQGYGPRHPRRKRRR